MLNRETPLRGHQVFRTGNAADLCREIQQRLGARCSVPATAINFVTGASHYVLPSGELWFTETSLPITLDLPDGPFVRMQIQRAGGGVTYIDGNPVEVNAAQSCISPAAAVLELNAGFQQLVLHVRHDVLVRKLVALTGVPAPRKLAFAPVLNRNRPESKGFIAILNCILANIDHATTLAPPLVLAELEDALMVSMLCNFQHNLRDLLDSESLEPGSWQVRRVEEYIEANLDAPFDIEQIAEVTGISTRSIYRAFKRSRGYSPMAFARQRRLIHARRLLQDAETNQTVTSIAFGCGFNDVGHFSREFSKAFGESPSAVLARSHRGGTIYARQPP